MIIYYDFSPPLPSNSESVLMRLAEAKHNTESQAFELLLGRLGIRMTLSGEVHCVLH